MRLYNSSTVFALETALFITVKLSIDILFFMIITQESFLLCLVFMVNRMGSLTCKLNSSCFIFFSFVRSVYPGSQGQFSELPGCGLLRLHSTYRHDLKIYASDEGRVQMTAAAFAKVTIQKLRSKS